MKTKILAIIFFVILNLAAYSQNEVQIARLKYSGGGDWYNDPSGEVNLLKYVQSVTGIKTKPEYVFVDINSDKIFNYPILFMTGHGNISFTEAEAKRLRKYLENGGFLYADDDYGMDQAFRREMKKFFQINNYKKYHLIIQFIIHFLSSKRDCQKFTNTIINLHRDLVTLLMADYVFSILTKVILVMGGSIKMFITILLKFVNLH